MPSKATQKNGPKQAILVPAIPSAPEVNVNSVFEISILVPKAPTPATGPSDANSTEDEVAKAKAAPPPIIPKALTEKY